MNSSLKDFIVGFPTTMCSPPSIPKGIVDMASYGDGKKISQWPTLPIPPLTPFPCWIRRWEIHVSTFQYMGWGLFILEDV
jgi:hypothetical protein